MAGAGLTAAELAMPPRPHSAHPRGRIADPALRGRVTQVITGLAQHASTATPALTA